MAARNDDLSWFCPSYNPIETRKTAVRPLLLDRHQLFPPLEILLISPLRSRYGTQQNVCSKAGPSEMLSACYSGSLHPPKSSPVCVDSLPNLHKCQRIHLGPLVHGDSPNHPSVQLMVGWSGLGLGSLRTQELDRAQDLLPAHSSPWRLWAGYDTRHGWPVPAFAPHPAPSQCWREICRPLCSTEGYCLALSSAAVSSSRYPGMFGTTLDFWWRFQGGSVSRRTSHPFDAAEDIEVSYFPISSLHKRNRWLHSSTSCLASALPAVRTRQRRRALGVSENDSLCETSVSWCRTSSTKDIRWLPVCAEPGLVQARLTKHN